MNQPEHTETFIKDLKVVVVVVKAGQDREQAWQSHLSKNPADLNPDVKIFHFAPQKAP